MSQVVNADELHALDVFLRRWHDPLPPVFLDIGANVGDYTAEVYRRFPAAQVVAFEPQSAGVRRLLERYDRNREFQVLPYALAEEEGRAELRCSYHDACVLATLHDRPDAANYHGEGVVLDRREQVEVRRLDDVGPRHVDWIKIDVEGNELSVLRGAERTLRRAAAVQFEYNDCAVFAGVTFADLHDHLTVRGFRLYREHPNKLESVETPAAEEWVAGDSTRNYLAISESASCWLVP